MRDCREWKIVWWCALLWGWGSGCQSELKTEPAISLDDYQVRDGYELQVIASEPLIQAPVELEFDRQGRMWVVELRGYMTNLEAEGEMDPTGRILILRDENGNGRMDQAKVFLDHLVAPRAICLAYGGLLYAEPPNLWFVEITDHDQAGKRTLVDSTYVLPGNIEHQANGLLLNLDNWIYSANSAARYRLRNGKWEKERTAFRGQWGITKDLSGRLYYNNNSRLLLGDRGLPQATLQNPFAKPRHTVNQPIAASQAIFPIHATLLNRGYQQGVLDSLGRATRASSACGPLIVGQLWPEDDSVSAFVCVPEGNLVAQLVLANEGGHITTAGATQQPWVAATDPAFRPVNLTTGPDGALYIVDMHRGVIQHRAYMTPYLYDQIVAHQLDTILEYGRIFRVQLANSPERVGENLATWSNEQLVEGLESPNVWVRDHAQQELILRNDQSTVPSLTKQLMEASAIASLHAFWTLEGLGALTEEILLQALATSKLWTKQAVLYTLSIDPQWASIQIPRQVWTQLAAQPAPELVPYMVLASLRLGDESGFRLKDLESFMAQFEPQGLIEDFFLSGAVEQEPKLLARQAVPTSLRVALGQAVEARVAAAQSPNRKRPPRMDIRTRGLQLYRQYCSSCHGADGRGIAALAPSLARSPYMEGQTETLGLVLLYGLQGPLHRGGETYSFSGVMPGFGPNPAMKDEDYVALIAYLRNAFGTTGGGILPQVVDSLRHIGRPPASLFSDKELQSIHHP